MKKNRIRQRCFLFLWAFITISASFLVMKSAQIWMEEDGKTVGRRVLNELMLDMTSYMVKDKVSLYQYADKEKGSGVVSTYLAESFTLGKYLMSEKDLKAEAVREMEQMRQEEKETEVTVTEGDQMLMGNALKEQWGIETAEKEEKEVKEAKKEKAAEASSKAVIAGLAANQKKVDLLKKEKDLSYLMQNFYITDSTTSISPSTMTVSSLLKKNLKMEKNNEVPQILIYHTHSQEDFADSKSGKESDTIVGVGAALAKELAEKYGYNVIHDTSKYDMAGGNLDRSKAYTYAAASLEQILKKNPSVEIMIDLHRDGVSNKEKRLTEIDGVKVAQVMLFNGLSRNSKGPIDYLHNPYIQENLAFSLQLHLASLSKYASYTRPIYLKGYRYNLHYRGKSLLVELGNQNNTVAEAKNSMKVLANLLDEVVSK